MPSNKHPPAAGSTRRDKSVPRPSLDPATILGGRIRHARTRHGFTLKQLVQLAGCSESMLSKIECGLASPSLATLHRIAQALQTNVAELTTLSEAIVSPVTRAAERPVVQFSTGKAGNNSHSIRLERLVPPVRGQLLQGDIHVLDPGATSADSIQHQGEEMGYVLQGSLSLTIGDVTYQLCAGDSFYFASEQAHSYSNMGEAVTKVLWINTPPTF
ncbi:cupin domain-containing protein [Polaromonas jejuensis]|uniref:Cupin domain-containing protein n=1 Tax=Polaromonas jejuensis TaxID=457502 RepID=A0ABW0QDB7_9BURK|nr:cupin domain-containing protein [Polaromonas jejuensis]